MDAEFIICGSGPSGITACRELVLQNKDVMVLDVGHQIEDEYRQIAQRLKQNFHDKNSDALEKLKEKTRVSTSGVKMKSLFGSVFPYRTPSCLNDIERQGVGQVSASYARGGLSNVWGASILPFREEELSGWPIVLDDLKKHYSDILKWMPHSYPEDELDEWFFSLKTSSSPLKKSQQAHALLSCMNQHRDKLKLSGIHFGQSKLAVQSSGSDSDDSCRYCGMCLYGCPYGSIFNSSAGLDQLLKNFNNLRYIDHMLVKEFQENKNHIKVLCKNTRTGEDVEYIANKLFLASGVLSTARIMKTSNSAIPSSIRMASSEYFMLPLYGLNSQALENESLHTLAQIFLEIEGDETRSNTAHLQIYTYNDMYERVVKEMCGPLARIANPLLKKMFNKLMVIQGYLHSEDSSFMEIHFEESKEMKVSLKGIKNEKSKNAIKKIVRKLSMNKRSLGFLPISFMLKHGQPGEGYHIGGSFPMKKESSLPVHTDILGRPHGFNKVHILDASILPGIPATTITFTVMANARRIVTEVLRK